MKTTLLLIIAVSFTAITVNAQWTVVGAGGGAFNNSSSGFPFFQTRSVGIGNFTTFPGFSPLAKLHINEFFLLPSATAFDGNLFRTDGREANANSWRMFTGPNIAGSTQKGRLFIPALSNNFNMESTLGSIELHAAGGNSQTTNNLLQRMVVTNGDYRNAGGGIITPNVTRVGISYGGGPVPFAPIVTPRSLLHLGFNTGPGHRNWMDIGMYIAKGDNMYVGLKEEGNNRQDAVINWGDDGVAAGPDNLRFIFTGVSGPLAGQFHGFETGRISPLGNWGIGNYYNNPFYTFGNPVRRLEILSDKQGANINGTPQLRLTHTQQDPANVITTGRISEFETTTLGNLGITTRDNALINTATMLFKERFVGVNTNTPGNTLEINSQFVANTTPNGQPTAGSGNPSGWAGLRFSDLRSNSIVQANPGTGVLSVNLLGDVIYVPGGGGTGSFGLCPIPIVLAGNSGTDLNNNNLYFIGQGGNNVNSIGVGYACSAPLSAKVDIFRNLVAPAVSNATALNVVNSDVSLPGPVQGQAFGIRTDINGLNQINIGIDVNSSNSWQCTGGRFTASSTIAQNNIGGDFSAFNGQQNYGIRASAPIQPNSYAGYFNGDVFSTGSYLGSDIILKKNIDSIQNAMGIINQLKPKTFDFKTTDYPQMNLPSGQQMGLIAQDVETILPNFVKESAFSAQFDSIGNQTTTPINFKSVKYESFIPLLIAAVQEQQTKIDSLSNAVAQLTSIVNYCCSNTNKTTNNNKQNTINITDVQLVNGQSIVLEQNVPNPFAEQTIINYFLPENTGKAQLLFYNINGQLIQSVELIQKGQGQLNVFANDLTNGLYIYALVVDGKIIETKKMIKE